MRIIASMLLLLSGSACFAQDLDFPDFRSKKDNFSKIREQDIRNDVASFSLAALDESIGKAQLAKVPVKDYGASFMSFQSENVQVVIRTGIFNPKQHKLMKQEEHVLRIDGKPYYGTAPGELPHTTIESITVIVGKDTVPVPANAYFDLYDPKFSYNEGGATRTRNGVFLSNDKHTFYIYMFSNDNFGVEYTWVIRDRQYLRRIVDFGFLRN